MISKTGEFNNHTQLKATNPRYQQTVYLHYQTKIDCQIE
jgi:hypothetical protein